MRISDWSSDVCSSDLLHPREFRPLEVDPVHDLESGRINDKNLLLEDIQGLSVRRHGKPGTIARAFVLRIDIDRFDDLASLEIDFHEGRLAEAVAVRFLVDAIPDDVVIAATRIGQAAAEARWADRRVGRVCVSKCSYRCSSNN